MTSTTEADAAVRVVAPSSDTSAPTDSLGRRERKKLATRDALVETSLRMFTENGFDETTVEDITEEVDVARRTFFRYFESKEAVLFASQSAQRDGLRTALDARPAEEGVIDSVRAAVRELAAQHSNIQLEQQLALAKIAMQAPSVAAYGVSLRAEWEQMIATWVAGRLGGGPSDMRPALVGGSCIAAMGAAMQRWLVGGGAEDIESLVDEALDLLTRGLGLEPSHDD